MNTFKAWGLNQLVAVSLLLPMRARIDKITATPGQVLLSLLTYLVVSLCIQAYWVAPVGGFSPSGFQSFATSFVILGIVLFLTLKVTRLSTAFADCLVLAPFLLSIGGLLSMGVWMLAMPSGGPGIYVMSSVVGYGPLVFAVGRLVWSSENRPYVRGLLTGITVAFSNVAGAFLLPDAWMLYEDYSADEAYYEESAYPYVDTEMIYYSQADLMQRELAALAPEQPGEIDLFVLGVAGTDYQNVFLSEIEAVRTLMEDRFDSEGHAVLLANSMRRPLDYPMANRRNIEDALAGLAERMNPEEDIALLFMTSHGSPDFFSLSFSQAAIRSVTSSEMKEILDRSGIGPAVIVISSCYSGSFIDDLAAPDRMIVTASAADRTSFGCSDENDWTWWGRAYFDTALRQTRDFRDGFEIAKGLVTEWEKDAGHKPSNPQVAIGVEIAARLDALAAQEGYEVTLNLSPTEQDAAR